MQLRTVSVLLAAAVAPVGAYRTVAWQPARRAGSRSSGRHSAAVVARVKNAASEEAEGFSGQVSRRFQKAVADGGDAGATATQKGKRINPDEPDLSSASETFDALCRMSGVPAGDDAAVDFGGFTLAFEQLFMAGDPLDPDVADELRAAVGSDGDEDVTKSDWAAFHAKYVQATRMDAVLVAQAEQKRVMAQAEEVKRQVLQKAKEAADKREQEFQDALSKANEKLAKAKEELMKREESGGPKLLADQAADKKKRTGKWFEERERPCESRADR